jgi:DNA-binding NtrC family response regulator
VPVGAGKSGIAPPVVVDASAEHGGGALGVDLTVLADLPYAEAKKRLLAHFDEEYTSGLLKMTSGNMSEAARRAGLDRSNFRRLLKRRRDEG